MPTNDAGGTPSPAVATGDGPSLDITMVTQTKSGDSSDYPPNRVCMVCFDGAEYTTNPLLCCSVPTCRMRVHLACYGSGTESKPLMPYRKRSKWVCDACAVEKQAGTVPTPNAQRACVVCKLPGGVVKPAKAENTVCHLVCVRWLPELKQVPSELHPTASVVDADLLNGTRKTLKCHICQKRNGCFQCMSKRCTTAFHAVCALRAPESTVYTGITEANHLSCICDVHFAEVRATYRSIKDTFWDQPYVGEEIDDDLDDGDVSDAELPQPVPTPLTAVPPTISMLPTPTLPFSMPPTPNKVGRPRKNPLPSQDPSIPKPMLPPPPGTTQVPRPHLPPPPSMSVVHRPRPPPPQKIPPPSLPPNATAVTSQPTDVAVCPWCLQPMLSSMLQVHQLSMCQSTPSQRNPTPKDSGLPKKPRGRPPGPNSKANKERLLLKQQQALAKAYKTDLPPPPPIVTAGPSPRPMMSMQPRPMPSYPPTPVLRPPMSHPMPSPQPPKDVLMENALGLLRLNAVDSMFASWPGMLGGGLLQSRDFWSQVFQAFFTKPVLTPAKWNPITQWLAGVSSQGFLQPLKPPSKCSDATTFAHITNEWLAATDVRHTCDAMLQSHGQRCAQPLKPFTHIKSLTRPTETSGIVEVVLASHNNRALHCRFAVVCSAHAPTKSESMEGVSSDVVWSRFRPNKSLVAMPDDADNSVPSDTSSATAPSPKQSQDKPLPIWIALLSSEEANDCVIGDIYDPKAVQATDVPIKDDMALEALLCWDLLQEQLKVNRMRMRSLWHKANAASTAEATAAATAKQVEGLYEEYSWWKSVCTSMIKGTKDMPFLDDPDGNLTTELQSFEDGTCVVCMDGISEDSNPIIFCDKCDVAVHQRCYGVAAIPKSDFFCDKCSAKGPVVPQCALCPHPHGALKQTVEGVWVHVFCTLWCPTTFLVKVPRMLFQLTPDPYKVRYAASPIDDLGGTTALADVVGLPPALQRGGLCRVCRIATGCTIQCRDCPASFHPLCAWFAGCYMHVASAACGFVCGGGGQGLRYTLTCMDHTPAALPCQDRELQRRQREQLYKSTDRDRCAVCLDPMPTLYPHHRFEALPTTHYFLRCVGCHVQCHAHCAHPVDKVDPHAPIATWQCEKCRVVAAGSITSLAVKPASAPCLLCDISHGYMLPAQVPSDVQSATATAAAGLAALAQAAGAVKPPAPVHPHVHLYCAKAFQQPILKTAKGRFVTVTAAAATPSTPVLSHKCAVCLNKAPANRVVTCWKKQCSVSFHPYCSATALWFSWKPTPKGKTLYCCSDHPPDFAAFDAARQVWITRDTLLALQEIRCSLERVRMFIDLSKQREKIKKRLFVQSDSRALDKVTPFLHLKTPSKTMKEVYHTVTNDRLVDVPKRKKPVEAVTPNKRPRKDLSSGHPPRRGHTPRHESPRRTTPQRHARHPDDSDADGSDDDEDINVHLALIASLWSQPVVEDDHDSMDDVMATLYPHHCPPDSL